MSRVLVHFDVGDPGLHLEIVDFLQRHRFSQISESVYEGSLDFGPQMIGLIPKSLHDFKIMLETLVRGDQRFGTGDNDRVFIEWASNGTIVPERINP